VMIFFVSYVAAKLAGFSITSPRSCLFVYSLIKFPTLSYRCTVPFPIPSLSHQRCLSPTSLTGQFLPTHHTQPVHRTQPSPSTLFSGQLRPRSKTKANHSPKLSSFSTPHTTAHHIPLSQSPFFSNQYRLEFSNFFPTISSSGFGK